MSPKVGVALSSPQRGLGLYATEQLDQGALVGFFTGIWGLDSDFDGVFGVDDVCVSSYGASHLIVLPYNRQRVIATTYSCTDVVDRLLVVPRISNEGSLDVTRGQCPLRFGWEITDIAALMNDSRSIRKATCEPVDCFVQTEDDDGNPELRAALAIRVRSDLGRPVSAGTELTFYYGHKKVPKTNFKGYKMYDWRRHTIKQISFEHRLWEGQAISREWELLRGVHGISSAFCGPPVYPIRCGDGGKDGNAIAIVAAQATGQQWTNGLPSLVRELPPASSPDYAAQKTSMDIALASQAAIERDAAEHMPPVTLELTPTRPQPELPPTPDEPNEGLEDETPKTKGPRIAEI